MSSGQQSFISFLELLIDQGDIQSLDELEATALQLYDSSPFPIEDGAGALAMEVTATARRKKIAGTTVPKLIESIQRLSKAFEKQAQGAASGPQTDQRPAVPIDESIQPDHLVCLEDGKKLKMLKRHLRAAYDLTPEQYRAKWGLPSDYPMTAPNYAKARAKLAKNIGLGAKVGRGSDRGKDKKP